jgi:hypothetical protein
MTHPDREAEIAEKCRVLRPYILKASENGLTPDEAFLVVSCEYLLEENRRLRGALDKISDGAYSLEREDTERTACAALNRSNP